MFENETIKFHKHSQLFVHSSLLVEDVDKLVELGILCKRDRWYQFQNEALFIYCIVMCIKLLDENKKQLFYANEIWDFINYFNDADTVYKLLEQADTIAFNKYFIRPILKEFIDLIEGKSDIEIAKYVLNMAQIEFILYDEANSFDQISRVIEAFEIIDTFKDFRYSNIINSLGERLMEDTCMDKYFCINKKTNKTCDVGKLLNNTQFIDIIESIDLPKKIYQLCCYIKKILIIFDQGDYSEQWIKDI